MAVGKEHRWSGWPGAFCLDCGVPDEHERCIAIHDALDFVCKFCGEHWPQGVCSATKFDHVVIETPCPEHVNGFCLG